MIESGDPFTFSGSYRNERIGVQIISDELVDLFRIVSFIEYVRIRFSGSVTHEREVFQREEYREPDVARFLKAGYNLTISIDGNRCFQESLSCFSGPPGIIRAGIRTGKSGWISS